VRAAGEVAARVARGRGWEGSGGTAFPHPVGLATYMLCEALLRAPAAEAVGRLRALMDGHPEFRVHEVPLRWDTDWSELRGAQQAVVLGTQTAFIERGLSLSSPSEARRRAAREALARAWDVAAGLGAHYLAVWGGQREDGVGARRQLEILAEELAALPRAARGPTVVVEPFPPCSVADSLIPDAASALALCRASGGRIGIMFDVAHHLLAGGDLPPAFPDLGPFVRVVQIGAGWKGASGVPEDRHPVPGTAGAIGTRDQIVRAVAWTRQLAHEVLVTFEVRPDTVWPADRVLSLLSRWAASLAETSTLVPWPDSASGAPGP
jgi:sugar phosphate isomerase/epimerase